MKSKLAGLMFAALLAGGCANVIENRMPEHRFLEMNLPSADGTTFDIVTGPDRNLWISQVKPSRLLRVSPIGELSKVALPAGSSPQGIVFDSKANLWVALKSRNSIARISTRTGQILNEYKVTSADNNEIGPYALALASDGESLWFSSPSGNLIGKLNTTTGEVNHYPLPNPGMKPTQIATDRNGNLWFIEAEGDQVGYVSNDGFVHEYPMPEGSKRPGALTADPTVAKMWFATESGGVFASIDTNGSVTAYTVPTRDAKISALRFDDQNRLWLGYASPPVVARANADMSVTEYNLPSRTGRVERMTLGSDGNIWFTLAWIDKLAQVTGTREYRASEFQWRDSARR